MKSKFFTLLNIKIFFIALFKTNLSNYTLEILSFFIKIYQKYFR